MNTHDQQIAHLVREWKPPSTEKTRTTNDITLESTTKPYRPTQQEKEENGTANRLDNINK